MKKSYYVMAGIYMAIAALWSIAALSPLPLLIIGGLVWWMLGKAKARDANQQSLNAELLSLVGAKPGDAGAYVYVHLRGESGIAINGASKKIALGKKGLRKAYAFNDVREWSSSKETASQVMPVGGGFALGTLAAVQNGAAVGAAMARTGFFVTVRDIDNPKWRVEMPSTGEQARWMEILRQAINRD